MGIRNRVSIVMRKSELIRHIYYALSAFPYLGSKYFCPCCRGKFRKFKEFWGGVKKGGRPNLMCPRCKSLERHRLLSLYLKAKTDIFTSNLKILHFAPEWCLKTFLKKTHGLNYVTADISSPLADMKMDITKITFADNYFDVILCLHVLEHIEEDKKAIKELYRVLKKNGWAIIMVPIDKTRERTYEDKSIATPFERKRSFGLEDHVRIYGLDFKESLEEAGFIVRVENYENEIEDEIVENYGLVKGEEIFVCRKVIKREI